MQLFDATYQALDAALGASSMRQQVISNNLANVNTPGYKRKEVEFDDALRSAIASADEGDKTAFDGLSPTVTEDKTASMRADGNSVNVDNEMAHLAENNVRYNALVQLVSRKLQVLEYVISDGRR
jgi:flagellar basal-body rod protein FlgB